MEKPREALPPDRFAHEPDKLDTYGKLTAAINRAKDNGDFATLRQIANDPHGFILKQGWVSLDFRDEEQAKRLAELYESLMAEIRSVHAARERLRQSPEFELYELTTKQPTMLDTVAEKQRKLLESEIAELNREAARLAGEIGKLTGNPPPGADDTPRARSPADEQEAAPPPPPPAQPEQRPSAAAAENLTGERNGQQPTTYVWYFCDRCRAENCTTDFFVGTRKACSHCGCEMIVPGTPTSNQSQHGEPREHPKAGPSASRTYYGMPEDEGYELRKWQHIRDRQKSTQVIRSIFYAIVGAFVGGMVGALACASLEFGDAGIGIAAFAIFGIGLGIRSARPKTIEQIAKKEARDYAKKYPSTTPTITTYVFAAIWWAFVGGFIGSFALLYFGEAAAGVGAWLGIILGIWLGIWSLKPSIRPPLPNSASVWDGKGWKTPKEIAEAKKDKPLSKTGEVIVGIIVFGILALIFGLPIACGAAALAWLTYSITTGIATATADEIEKRKKP